MLTERRLFLRAKSLLPSDPLAPCFEVTGTPFSASSAPASVTSRGRFLPPPCTRSNSSSHSVRDTACALGVGRGHASAQGGRTAQRKSPALKKGGTAVRASISPPFSAHLRRLGGARRPHCIYLTLLWIVVGPGPRSFAAGHRAGSFLLGRRHFSAWICSLRRNGKTTAQCFWGVEPHASLSLRLSTALYSSAASIKQRTTIASSLPSRAPQVAFTRSSCACSSGTLTGLAIFIQYNFL